jgi:phosphatidylglycerophosphatase A
VSLLKFKSFREKLQTEGSSATSGQLLGVLRPGAALVRPRLVATSLNQAKETCRDRSRPAKAQPGQRTPKSSRTHLIEGFLKSVPPMTVKESSDELNPTVTTADEAVAAPRAARSAKDYLALAIATCGVGYLPLAPGTWGSLVGVGLYLLLEAFSLHFLFAHAARNSLTMMSVETPRLALLLVVVFVVTIVGIWAATRAERLLRRKDPSVVVIDEVAGQLIALLSAPTLVYGWWGIISAFLLFRVFDIWKPYPARRLEQLESGLGIMSDDVVAGAYAAVVNSIILGAYFLFRFGT